MLSPSVSFYHLPLGTGILDTAITVKIATTENIDFKCSHTDDFLYTMPHDHCASYYRCQSHQMIRFDCPLGMIFDFYMQICVSSSSKFHYSYSNFFLLFIESLLKMHVMNQHAKERLMDCMLIQRKHVEDIFDALRAK
jgi:hypothetical protein